jgi:hypothetical protein
MTSSPESTSSNQWRLYDVNGVLLATAKNPDDFDVNDIGRATFWALKQRDVANVEEAVLVNEAQRRRRVLRHSHIWPAGTPGLPLEKTLPPEPGCPPKTKQGFIPAAKPV